MPQLGPRRVASGRLGRCLSAGPRSSAQCSESNGARVDCDQNAEPAGVERLPCGLVHAFPRQAKGGGLKGSFLEFAPTGGAVGGGYGPHLAVAGASSPETGVSHEARCQQPGLGTRAWCQDDRLTPRRGALRGAFDCLIGLGEDRPEESGAPGVLGSNGEGGAPMRGRPQLALIGPGLAVALEVGMRGLSGGVRSRGDLAGNARRRPEQ